jgi:tripartite-type tricarboxylate transporter receptor subunit TctC
MRALSCLLPLGAWLFACSTPALADDVFPSQAIRLVIPMVAAGSTDVMARIIVPKMAAALGQPMVIDNRPGGNGLIGEEMVARAKPDGYTLMLESTAIAINPSLNAQNYDPLKAFLPVSQAAAVPLILAVNSTMQAQNVKELIAEVKAKPGAYTYASFGNGSIAHFAGEIFKLTAGLDMAHIAYKGSPQAVNDTIGGQVNMMFAPVPTIVQHFKAGKVRGLAITAPVRSGLAPLIPTMAEAGVSGMEVQTWFGFFLPAGTPVAIANRYHEEIQKAFKLPDVRVALDAQGFTIIASTPADFTRAFHAEVERFARVVKQAHIKADG